MALIIGGKASWSSPPQEVVLSLSPQLFEQCRIGGGINDGVLNVPVPQIILYQARVRPLIGQGKPAGVPQHVRMHLDLACRLDFAHGFIHHLQIIRLSGFRADEDKIVLI